MDTVSTTPLEREILTHYFTSPEPWRNGSENWAPVHCEIVENFIRLGLLIREPHPAIPGAGRIRGNEPALRVYMDALAAVPLPEQRWVVSASTPRACICYDHKLRLEPCERCPFGIGGGI